MLDRRQMMAVTGAALATNSGAMGANPRLTAAAVIDRIKTHVGIPWADKTVDGIVAGDPNAEVKGIATVMMATYGMLKTAVARGQNLIITHEPTFWSHQEDISGVKNDPLYLEKLAFIKQHDLVTFHFHDHWHGLKPRDGIAEGMMRRLGWSSHVNAEKPYLFTLPITTLGALASDMVTKLHARTMRVIGDPAQPVSKVQTSWGYMQKPAGIADFNTDIDLLVCGETWEWELQEYAADLVASGRKKALIVLGHINSEQWGMQYCAEWMQGFVKEVPVRFLEMGEPYWSPRV